MMSVEMIKTMGCIKEVNESDVSETSSPAPSPSMFMSDAARARMKEQRSGIFICRLNIMFRSFDFKIISFEFRPALVKQKQSIQVKTKSRKKVFKLGFQAFNFPDSHAIAQHHFKELGRELSGRGDGPMGKEAVTNSSLQSNVEIEVSCLPLK